MAALTNELLSPMSEADLDEVAALERTLYVHPWTRGNFADSLAAGYPMRLLRRDAELIAYFILLIGIDEGHLLNVSVALPWQRQGYGARLIEYASAICREYHVGNLLLEVRPSNLPAQSLYNRHGFRQVGVRRGYYPKGDIDQTHREDALVMMLAL
jgi:ribosomal-protein-alanine acetyltransferase